MFEEVFNQYDWAAVKQSIYGKTAADVERALAGTHRDLEDFKALISPAAAPYLEEMAQLSQRLTQKRFGKVIQLYIPLYLSNECQNICTYCGFSHDNKIRRRTLTAGELLTEAGAIRDIGIRACAAGERGSQPDGRRGLFRAGAGCGAAAFFAYLHGGAAVGPGGLFAC